MSCIEAFIKAEDYFPELKEARLIMSRCDCAKVAMGPAFAAIEEELYKLPYFAKHMNEVQKRIVIRNFIGKVISIDFTAFEASFTPAVMCAFELVLYKHMLKNYPRLSQLICSTIAGRNCISTRAGVNVTVYGRRMSGDMCTSLGNGFTNLMLSMFLASEQGKVINGLFEGDDALIETEAVLTREMYSELGFDIKLKTFEDPTSASFCGLIFSTDQVIKNPFRVLANYGWTRHSLNGGVQVMRGLLKAKALSMGWTLPACPILAAVSRRSLELTRGAKARFEDVDSFHKAPPSGDPPYAEPDIRTRQLFERLYGVSCTRQVQIEQDIMNGVEIEQAMRSELDHYATTEEAAQQMTFSNRYVWRG